MKDRISFHVTRLEAAVPGGVPVEWQGRQFESGRLSIELDPEAPPNQGSLDYRSRKAEAEFHVLLRFPEFSETLKELGADPEMARPVRAVLRSEGAILEDHSFALSGACRLAAHLFSGKGAAASVLPGQ